MTNNLNRLILVQAAALNLTEALYDFANKHTCESMITKLDSISAYFHRNTKSIREAAEPELATINMVKIIVFPKLLEMADTYHVEIGELRQGIEDAEKLADAFNQMNALHGMLCRNFGEMVTRRVSKDHFANLIEEQKTVLETLSARL